MSHDSIRNKALVQFPNGKMMLLCEVSCSNVTDWNGKRCWDKCLIHPKETLYWTKESLKKEQTDYVERQLSWLRDFRMEEVKRGYAQKYEEPTLDSYDYCGTVFPGGSRIRNGKAFYGGRPVAAEEYFSRWDAPKRIEFNSCDKDLKTTYRESFDILRADLDECYQDAKKYGQVYIGIH